MYLPKEVGQKAVADMLGLLAKTGLDNRGVAKMLGIHERTLYKWLSGERRVPRMATQAMSNVALRQAIKLKKARVKIMGLSAKDIDAWLAFDA